jgi:hypothetical protein
MRKAVAWENGGKKEMWKAEGELVTGLGEGDLRVMQVGRWWEKVESKEEWRRIVREAKAYPRM